jgi:sugar O-acyltransferase (sialic acid O-acetyltransferase NeuD family)
MSLKNLVIVGAGGFGREVYHWAKQSFAYETEFTIKGFLDDGKNSIEESGITHPVLGKISEYLPNINDIFIMAIAAPKIKLEIAQSLISRGAKFTNVIHKSSIIIASAKIGSGIVVCPFSVISSKSVVEDHVFINTNTTIGHDAFIGKGSTISGHCDITGNCHLEEGVFLGSHACMVPKSHIGSYAIIGAGSCVIKKVAAAQTVVGVPAKKLF